MTLSSPVQFTSLAARYLEGKPYTTMTWFDTGADRKRSPATISQILESFCDCIGSIFLVFFVNIAQLHSLCEMLVLSSASCEKKRYCSQHSNPFWQGWLPGRTTFIAACCSLPSNIMYFIFSIIVLPVIVISEIICSNFWRHVLPDSEIYVWHHCITFQNFIIVFSSKICEYCYY